MKVPVVLQGGQNKTYLIYCQHPFCWSSGYSGCAVEERGKFKVLDRDILPRGYSCQEMIAVWQKSMPDCSQPLVLNRLSRMEVAGILK